MTDAALNPNFPQENVFGKMRGRYDEMLARRVTRTQFQEILDLLSADDVRLRDLCAAYNERAQRVGNQHRLHFV